jgi:hypothetical protein
MDTFYQLDGKKEKGCVTMFLNVPFTFVTPQISKGLVKNEMAPTR